MIGRLSLVFVQIWMVVQRKWMYLESIFLAGDIRAQLPEEAKKFDNIDKLFKKVCYAQIELHMCNIVTDWQMFYVPNV